MATYAGLRFVGRPIDRAATLSIRKDAAAVQRLQEGPGARFLLVHSKRVAVSPSDPPAVVWWTLEKVRAVDGGADREAIYLGPVVGDSPVKGCEGFAVDLGPFVAESETPLGCIWKSGRELMLSDASDTDVTIAGLALGIADWHGTARFDGRTGQPTEPIEGGLKRLAQNGMSKVYPRTDPVAIGLIISPDGRRVLLGRSSKYPKGFYTCLAGFVEQCESVEEAFRREAFEEAGIELASVHLVASQPWPFGRAGSCELMVGCQAVAASDKFKVNSEELEHARWFGREEVLAMLQGTHAESLMTPGKFAIAHHLIGNWAYAQQGTRYATAPVLAGLFGLFLGVVVARFYARL